ncbi:hypothetical protein NPIL_577091 [Nephila pilipes]|uniref:Uncharacterized protein n=1 Tax=Nephila pilipes TaxID=299642 RepID=A0A8X6TQN5_NEPPI|nr:hypothetical protein NPIL_577091 [Nephila pilipes]
MPRILDFNDVVSEAKCVDSLRNIEDCQIILFQDQNISNGDNYLSMKTEDVLLYVMHCWQKDMLNFYGNDTTCLDFTHGMNTYGFDLATVLV